MTLSNLTVEIRSPKYTDSGTARTTIATTQSDITKIVLPVSRIGYTVNKTIDVNERIGNADPHLQMNGMGTKSITVSGAVTTGLITDVDPAWIVDDLRYAADNWYTDAAGDITVATLVWKEPLIASASDKTFTLGGFIQRWSADRQAGKDNAWDYNFVFLIGAVE
jgi:hypothetical protein